LKLTTAFLLLTACAFAQSTLTPPAAITDPAKLQSKTIADMQTFSIEKLYTTRNIGGSTWSPDGKQVAFVANITGRNNIWTVPASGGWPTQLTISDQRQTDPAWSPDGKWIAYASDYDGNEQWDIFLVSAANGDVQNLTTTKEIAENAPVWAPDGRSLAYLVKPKTSPNTEIDLMEITTRRVRHITQNTPPDWIIGPPLFSRDGKVIAFSQQRSDLKDANIFLVDLATGARTNLTPHDGEHLYFLADLSPDGRTAILVSDAENDYFNTGLLDIGTKKIEWLTDGKWQVDSGAFSRDGHSAVWTTNVDGQTTVYSYDLASKQTRMLALRAGVNTLAGNPQPYSPDGSRLLVSRDGADSPRDLWVYDFATRQAQQITHSLVAGLRSSDLVEPYLVHYPSRDGKFAISAFAYVPNNIKPNGKFPAIVYIHGGPASQFEDSFNPLVQYLVNQGYLIIAPNYRGSLGYGKEFMNANFRDEGGNDLNDVLDAAAWISKSPFVDPKKLVVMGRSYGGYLTMMAVTKAPNLWAAGVPIVPFVNWFTEIQNEDPELRQGDLAIMGDPVENKKLYEDRSPINFISQVKAPLLIMAGGNDPRCPKSEAQQVADTIRKNGGIAQLKIYENEGHVFARVENQIDAYQRVSDFLKVRVPSPGCGCSIYE
jgi:dipeptidyl aminopeptidase/acylaminoacyl peptidase